MLQHMLTSLDLTTGTGWLSGSVSPGVRDDAHGANCAPQC